MVLLAAAICTKNGKALVSRQFVEMTKARIEGLLSAFPKLITTGAQHTFVETDSVRYVYQPHDRVYMVLITTRASNILEDLETLRLFSRVIPEYCRSFEEKEIQENAFHLIFAFDEIVALGYRESVNLAQIRTFVEMDSHEEKVYKAVRETQEREARTKGKEKAKELQRKRYEESKHGKKASSITNSGGFGGGSSYTSSSSIPEPITPIQEIRQPAVKPSGANRAMKLGSKSKDVDSFVDQLKSEGERIVSSTDVQKSVVKSDLPDIDIEPIHITSSEELIAKFGREGGVEQFEIQGILKLRIADVDHGFIKIEVDNDEKRPFQLQTHPNIDRDLWRTSSQIAMKMSNKPFPPATDVGVLKWRLQTNDDSFTPLYVNVWPQEDGAGSCEVNILYELADNELTLDNVKIVIPSPSPPVINSFEGLGEHEYSHGHITWIVPVVEKLNKTGSLEFKARGDPSHFFPVKISFTSKTSFCRLKVGSVVSTQDGTPCNFSSETVFKSNSYEYV